MTLADYMRKRALSPETVATQTGLHLTAVYRHMVGDRYPGPDNLRAYRDWSGGKVTPNDFLDQWLARQREREAA